MKNSEIYKVAILAVVDWQDNPATDELSADNFCEVLYKLTQDWYWSREAEMKALAPTLAKEVAHND